MITRDNALLVRVKIKAMGTGVADREISNEVHTAHHVSDDAGTYIKRIFLRKDLENIYSGHHRVVTVKKRYTLPWMDGNIRLLPSKAFNPFTKELQSAIDQVNEAVEDIANNLDIIKEKTKVRLSNMYKEEEFPSAEAVREAFGVRVSYLPIPDKGDFRVGGEKVKSTFDTEMQEQVKLAQGEIWRRFKEVISHFHKMTSEKDKGFTEALLDKIEDLTKLAKVLNMDDDKNIEQFRKEVSEKLTGFLAKDLKDDKALRDQKAKEAKVLLEKLKNYM